MHEKVSITTSILYKRLYRIKVLDNFDYFDGF